jgi:menaquinol-cytochrome c reductase cytochrome b/c subunit
MADNPEIDQETYDKLISEGQPERVARAKAKAAAVRKAKKAESAGADGGGVDAGGGEDPDAIAQRVYDELIAEGQPERVARAKSKAAKVRAEKKAGAAAGGGGGDTAAKPAAAAASSGGPQARGGGGVAAPPRPGGEGQGNGHGAPLTPEERQQRVAAALAAKGGGPHARTGGQNTKYAGQEHTHRLLAMVPPTGIQQIRGKQEDKVYTWPHLLSAEFVALLAVTAFVVVFSAFAPAPLRELANSNVTPNPSKAPWYFLGLQELLRYFHPMVAGVTIPGIVGLLGLMTIPYVDKNPSVKPENRKLAYTIFTFFLVGSAILTMVGSFFRGPGFLWTWPWTDGIWFTL